MATYIGGQHLYPSARRAAARYAPKTPARTVTSNLGLQPVAQSPQDWLTEQVNRIVQSQVDAVNAQKQAYLDDLQRQSDLEMQRGQMLSAALQGLNVPGRISNIYGNASADIGGLANAFSGQLRNVASSDAARETQMLAGSGQEGAVRNEGAGMGDVLYGVGGYIPARNMSETGAAFASQAALEPGFAQRIGALKAGDVYSSGLDNLRQFTDAILDIQSKRPEIEQDLTKQFNDLNAPDISYRNLANGQIQAFDDRTGKPVGDPYGPTKAKGGSGKNTIRSLANGQLQAFDAQGRPVGKPYGPMRESASATKVSLRNLSNGQIQRFDAQGNPIGKPIGPPRAAAAKAKKGGYNLQFKDFGGYHQWVDPRTTKTVGPRYPDAKTSSGGTTGRSDGVTPTQARDYKQTAFLTARDWHKSKGRVSGFDEDGKPVVPSYFTTKEENGNYILSAEDVLKTLVNDGGVPVDIAVKQMARFTPKARQWLKSNTNPLNGQPLVDKTAQLTSNTQSAQTARIVQAAYRAGPGSGTKYVFGGASPAGYDCSGYTMDMVRQATGVSIPHNAHDQFVDPRGMKVPPGQLQAGDLVFFRSSPNDGGSQPPWHVGYYIGNGEFIEYYSSGQPARVSHLSDRNDYMGARRFGGGGARA